MTKKILLLALAALLVFAGAAEAKTAKTTPQPAASAPQPAAPAQSTPAPNPANSPVLASLMKTGAKLYYMGNRGGLDSWFILKNGRMQILYAASDNKTVVIGAMFGENGENISSIQVRDLLTSNKEVADVLNGAIREQAAIAEVGHSAPQATPSGLPSAPVSPGEQLVQDLSAASGVTVGTAGPLLYMVMDPNCPHCQKTWKEMRDAVFKQQLQVRMIPIATPDTDDARAAAILLRTADPLPVWDKYVAGDKAQLAGTPDAETVAAVLANHKLTDSWHINATPYLVYRDKAGKVKVVMGEPDKLPAVLADMAP